jgi:hypothetical protein
MNLSACMVLGRCASGRAATTAAACTALLLLNKWLTVAQLGPNHARMCMHASVM